MGSPGLRNVVVTGSSGLIGRALCTELEGDYAVTRIDRRKMRGESVRGKNLVHPLAARRAVRGSDTVIDLAAGLRDRWRPVRRNNIPVTWNTLDAARRLGVRRVIYFSSNHVTGMYERDRPFCDIITGRYGSLAPDRILRLNSSTPPRPDGPYGVGKAFGEAAGRYFSDRFGISVICLRIGTVNLEDRPTDARGFSTLLTKRDLCHLVRCCIEAPPEIRFAVFYGVSANTWRFWDIDEAEAAIGYRPEDDAEQWRTAAG